MTKKLMSRETDKRAQIEDNARQNHEVGEWPALPLEEEEFPMVSLVGFEPTDDDDKNEQQ